MRICFIADSGSLHVKRIVSHHVNRKDDVLILSTAWRLSDIVGTKTIHLLASERFSSVMSRNGTKCNTEIITRLKSYIPSSLIIFIKSLIRIFRLMCKRNFCIQKIKGFDPEVIYCFRSFPEGVLASNCHVKPLLLRTAGPDISKYPRYPIYKQLIRKALQSADIVVTESQWERELLQNMCKGKISPEVIVIGVDTLHFRPAELRDALRDKYQLPRNGFIVISNRYLDSHYNGWSVLEAIKSVLDECPELILLYINPLPLSVRMKSKMEDITTRFQQIKFLEGPLPHDEMAQVLGCGDVYISFSSFDGVPNSLLEAMACGLVPIVGKLPQLNDWIENGVNGFIIRQHDINGLASLVIDLYKGRDKLPSMAARGVSMIREQASYERCMEHTRSLLESLIERRKCGKHVHE